MTPITSAGIKFSIVTKTNRPSDEDSDGGMYAKPEGFRVV
jgi:hypothetical protein